jgi:signal transduction histidine kinase
MQRGRLFRRYFMLILALVCGALLLSGGIGLYFSYQENKLALANLQHEKALAAAARIEQFVLQIEQQLAYAAMPQLGVEGLEQRRIEFLKLLRTVHAVTDITQIDAKGREQLSVSRLKMDEAGTERDWSQEPAFKNARPGQTWYGPVYFRKETEPYMSIAVRAGGEQGAVTVAEVNLKFIWDVVTRIKVGQKGKAYVVDGTGYLVADPDIGLVLRKTSMSQLEQVQSALKPDADDSLAVLATDLGGHRVLTAYAPIEPARDLPIQQGPKPTPLGWKVFVEQPVSEVYQSLDATVLRTVALLVAGLLFSALAAAWLARSMARPISVLQEGAQRIGAGDLDTQIQMKTGDELESLADQFNRMTAQLRESYAGLERKVEERTAELKQALEFQSASGEILSSISSSIANTQPVFDAIVKSVRRLFGTSYAAVCLIRDGKFELVAAAGDENFLAHIRKAYPIPVSDTGMLATRAIGTGQVVQLCPIIGNPDAPPRSEQIARESGYNSILVTPMMREGAAIGHIATARREAVPFDDKQVALVKAFADQAVIAIENARLVNETREALDRQTATADVLRVISGSPTDTQPVFDAILESATKLCDAPTGILFRFADGAFQALAMRVPNPEFAELFKAPRRPAPDSKSGLGRLMRERRAVHIPDILNDPAYAERDPLRMETVQVGGVRTWLGVPMLREGELIGAILIYRTEPRAFSEQQIALLQTFADQAVIAIENVRLFNETKESLEQQTATGEILRVIAQSPTDVQPVFDAIAGRALRLFDFDGLCVAVALARSTRLELAALATADDVQVTTGNAGERRAGRAIQSRWRGLYPAPLDATSIAGRTIVGKQVQTIERQAQPDELPAGAGSAISVPLLREAAAIGTVTLYRRSEGQFTDKQIALLKTFADQAVIAIENVRLFNETKESLDQQTAISEVLRVMSDSPSNVQPVLGAVASRAARLCDSTSAAIYVLEGKDLRRAAFSGPEELKGSETLAFDAGTLTGRTIAEGKPIHIEDLERVQHEFPISWELAQKYGRQQSMLALPLMREGRAFGTMFLRRTEVRSFTEKQIALATTFADQAAIAIENVRLFNETKEALEQQKASADVLGAISSSIADTKPVFDKIIESCTRLFAGHIVGINLVGEDGKLYIAAFSGRAQEDFLKHFPAPLDQTGTGHALRARDVVHFPDVEHGDGVPLYVRNPAANIGVKSVIFAPMIWEGRGIGAIFVGREFVGDFSEKQIRLLKTFADQAVIAIQNARLFREIQEKSAQLEIANKHKSEFLANMSHELRTPLNAIIGFSEVLMDKMFGEVNEKQADYLKDIHESGRHLLSLINDILDLSKIEAGRMDLEISSFHLPTALSNAMTLVRERAQRHSIALGLKVDPQLGEFQADERKFKQIVVNLLSNAVKFTPDGGRVDVSAKRDTTKIEIAVQDTGIGIAPEDQAAVFEEFKQVGRDYTRKAEGTGLGLALTKRFVELHGGEIHLASAPGKGSTFTITLPIRH